MKEGFGAPLGFRPPGPGSAFAGTSVGGRSGQRGDLIAPPQTDHVRGSNRLRIVAGALGPQAAARGVARIALSQVHEDLCRSAGRGGGRGIAPRSPHGGGATSTVGETDGG